MTRIIRQVTTVSTRMQLSLSHLSTTKLLESAVERFRSDHNLPLHIEISNRAEKAVVLANVEVFEDAMGKLLLNAWESYGAQPPADASVLIDAATSDRDGRAVVTFIVHDRGNGLDARVRDHVFEPFVSTKSTVGVGMGLTIARHGIRNLGGDISLTDRPGGGTSASFFLPLASAAVTATAA
jgi:signal transduction histidine kinase